jgi:hypothetical protein
MTGREILKTLYKLIHQHYALGIPEFDLQVDDGFWSNDEIINELKGHASIIALPKIFELLDAFKEVKTGAAILADEYVPLNNVELLDLSQPDYIKRNRAFSFSDLEFGYLSLKKLHKINPLSAIDSASQDYKTLIDYIATAISNAENIKITNLLNHIQNSHEDWGILVHKFPHAHDSLSIYSYIYYKELLQGGKIDLDHRLSYTLVHGATITFSDATKYEQYFEVFDIINELNHANETITRFLKLYHILEYLVYRAELVKLEVKARVNRTFIREIHGFTGKGQSEKEFAVFKRSFTEIFQAELAAGAFDLNPLTPQEGTFLKSYWGVEITDANCLNHTNGNQIAQLIYRIRNSIVHNKESEFHITITNPDDYMDVIDLMKRFIQKLERQVFDKISSDAASISYQSQNIKLY